MTRIDLDGIEGSDDQRRTTWVCAVCGRARLCPYAAPSAGDPTQACWSCGDLLAHTAQEAMPLEMRADMPQHC